jgi:hypothetical protein
MKLKSTLRTAAIPMVLAGVVLTACRKAGETTSTVVTSTAAPAATGAPAPATPSSASSSPAPAAPSAPGAGTAETTAKMAAAEWALKQDAIKNDADGQWAVQSTASSAYNDAQGTASWSANQVTGKPDVDKYGDDGHAWAPKTQDAGIEWLDLKYPRPVHATEVRIRESCGSGAVIRVELFDEKGTPHIIWAGNDPTTGLNYLMVKFPRTEYKSDRVKVTLATNVIPGWNEIDAVQLVGKDN